MTIFGIIGLIIISAAVWIRNERRQNIFFIAGGLFLLVYSLSIQSAIFSILQIVFVVSALIELAKLSGPRKEKTKEIGSLEQARQTIIQQKSDTKQKILKLFGQQNEIRNDDIEKLLGVSDSTATNYLEELEKEGKISQHGDTGRGVFYTKING
ncbi:MAG: FaeA/PapI family transcriptional regulator [bacterium]|nr:FaeA/PapI family transcriptional regulator [bacterium]